MSQSNPNNNKPSKLNNLLDGKVDQSVKARLPRATSAPHPQTPTLTSSVSDAGSKNPRFKFGPPFWTIASIMSLSVNVVLLAIGLLALRSLGVLQITANDQASSILGGLYLNFVKMDAASIKTNIHVEKEIPVQFNLNVSGPTDVTLSQDVVINGALVTVETGGLNIVNARARIVLPQGTVLPITIQNLVVPVDQKVMAILDVPVDIPLSQTELHEPFVGLKNVVEPFYCFIEPNTILNGVNVCSPITNAQPATEGTVIP